MPKQSEQSALNYAAIKKLEAKPQRYEVYDSVVSGFNVRVYTSGLKTYSLMYRVGTKQKRITIGKVGELSLADARKKALEYRALIKDNIDPQKIREANKKEAERKPLTVRELAAEFEAGHFDKLETSTRKVYKSTIQRGIVDAIGFKTIEDLTRRELKRFLKTFADKGQTTHGNRVHAVLSKMLNFAVDEEIIEANPIAGLNKLSSEDSRKRIYSDEEIRALWGAIEMEDAPAQGMLKMLLLTGQRRGEVAGMEWEHIDESKRVWFIPAENTKNGKEQAVPLCPDAWAIIEKMHGFNPGNKYVFNSAHKADTQIGAFTRLSNRIRRNSGVNDFRIHDFRRTVASHLAEIGTPRHVLKKVLNHATGTASDITNVYDRYEYLNEKRAALTLWSEALQAIIKGEDRTAGNVTPISKAGA